MVGIGELNSNAWPEVPHVAEIGVLGRDHVLKTPDMLSKDWSA